MPAKRKQKVLPKVTTKRVAKKVSNKLVVAGLIVVALVLAGLVAAKSMMKTGQVALISVDGGVGGPVASSVCGTISAFNVAGQCSGKPTFTTATYTCTTMNGVQNVKSTSPKTQTLSCVGVSSLYDLAYKTCSTTCLRPSPYPTSTAYPSPSVKPTPVASGVCGQEYGTCLNRTKSCITYTDSCQKAANCLTPLQQCGPSSTLVPKGSPLPTSTPSNTAAPRPTAVPTK